MSLESNIADLNTATAGLLTAINIQKTVLDATVASTAASASAATASASTASTQAGTATVTAKRIGGVGRSAYPRNGVVCWIGDSITDPASYLGGAAISLYGVGGLYEGWTADPTNFPGGTASLPDATNYQACLYAIVTSGVIGDWATVTLKSR